MLQVCMQRVGERMTERKKKKRIEASHSTHRRADSSFRLDSRPAYTRAQLSHPASIATTAATTTNTNNNLDNNNLSSFLPLLSSYFFLSFLLFVLLLLHTTSVEAKIYKYTYYICNLIVEI